MLTQWCKCYMIQLHINWCIWVNGWTLWYIYSVPISFVPKTRPWKRRFANGCWRSFARNTSGLFYYYWPLLLDFLFFLNMLAISQIYYLGSFNWMVAIPINPINTLRMSEMCIHIYYEYNAFALFKLFEPFD